MPIVDAVSFAVIVGGLLWLISIDIHPTLGGLAIGAAFILGAARQPFWSASILAIGATMLNLGQSFFRGMPFHQDGVVALAGLSLAMFGIVCGAGWLLGRLACRLVRKEMSTQTQ